MGSTKQVHGALSMVPGFGEAISGASQAGKKSLLPAILGGLGSAFLGPAGPIVGSLAGAALNFGLNRIETGIQNRYNSPKKQLQRLSQAGLPGAAYFGSHGGNESASSSQTYAQSDLGTAESISREQVNRMQKQQFELMERDMLLREAQARKARADAYQSEIFGDFYGRTPGSNYILSNFGRMVSAKTNYQEKAAALQQYKSDYQVMLNDVYNSLKNKGIQVAKGEEELKILQNKVPFQKVQEALMDQQVQESISRINKNLVSIAAMNTQMSVAEQTIMLRQLDQYTNQLMLKEMQEKKVTPMQAAGYKLIFGKGFQPFK